MIIQENSCAYFIFYFNLSLHSFYLLIVFKTMFGLIIWFLYNKYGLISNVYGYKYSQHKLDLFYSLIQESLEPVSVFFLAFITARYHWHFSILIGINTCIKNYILVLLQTRNIYLAWNFTLKWRPATNWCGDIQPWVAAVCVTAPSHSLNLRHDILLNHQRRWNSYSDNNKENSVNEGPYNASRCMRFP